MSELLRGTDERQRRVTIVTGVAIAAVLTLVVAVLSAIPTKRPLTAMDVVVSTPILGQGIDANSKVVLHGVVVGAITAIDNRGTGTDIRIRFDRNKISGLTDAFGFDFRPQNTFGVSALNITPRAGGVTLTDGQHIDRAPEVNATMSQLLSGEIAFVNDVITDKLVQLIRRTSSYTSALAPLIETGFVLANQVAETQNDSSDQLLRRFNTMLRPVPDLIDSLFWSVENIRYLSGWHEAIDNFDVMRESLILLATGFFGPVGDLLGKHKADFAPAAEIGRSLADATSAMVQRSRGGLRLDKLFAGLNDVYSGPEGVKSAKLRVVLEPLPVLDSVLPALSNLDGNGTP